MMVETQMDSPRRDSFWTGGSSIFDIEDFLPDSHIIIHPDAEARENFTSEKLIEVMVHQLARLGLLKNPSEVLRQVLEREKLQPTCLKNGIAIPHARTDNVQSLSMACAILKSPVPFGATGVPDTNVVFLTIAPRERSGDYLKVISDLMVCLSRKGVPEALARAEEGAVVRRLLKFGVEKKC